MNCNIVGKEGALTPLCEPQNVTLNFIQSSKSESTSKKYSEMLSEIHRIKQASQKQSEKASVAGQVHV